MARRPSRTPLDPTADVRVVGAREPCPCGSGRRYKACHGRAARAPTALVRRPFEGLVGECDWVALREFVPAATAPLTLRAAEDTDDDPVAPLAGRQVTLATVLPMAWPALSRTTGEVMLGLQVVTSSGDVSRELADALLRAADTEPGQPVPESPAPGPGPRLQDLLDPAEPLVVQVRDGFDFWLEGVPAEDPMTRTPDVAASLERANASVVPTVRLVGVEAAYWCQIGERRHLRWVLPHDEDRLLDALARLHAGGRTALLPGSRLVGSFRAHGLLVPVWDLPETAGADDLEDPAADFQAELTAAMAEDIPLDARSRQARNSLRNRQLTLR